ncbi:MAG TPA: hypothetical protein VHQ90_00920 [Thermoanaerobaculia bacterium]|nr:hypothetical protein [Thermoanaerobaculia bacterium]
MQTARTAPPKTPGRTETEKARTTLGDLLEVSGVSRRQLSRRLREQGCDINLHRLFSGRLALKLHHILDITAALGLHPMEFFRIIFAEPEQPSPLLRRLASLLGPTRVRPLGPPAVGREEFDQLGQRVTDLTRRVEQLATSPARPAPPAGHEPEHSEVELLCGRRRPSGSASGRSIRQPHRKLNRE